MPKQSLKVGDRVILRETPDIYGVIVHQFNPETSPIEDDKRQWSVHWYNAPRRHPSIRSGRGIYETNQIKKENSFKKDE